MTSSQNNITMDESKELAVVESVDESNISGLDEDDEVLMRTVYIKHENDPTVFIIDGTSARLSLLLRESILNVGNVELYGLTEDNPMVISAIATFTMPFIAEYMLACGDDEPEAPEAPLQNVHISGILVDEYKMFARIYDEDGPLKATVTHLNDYIQASLYMGLKELTRKICAIIANLLRSKSIEEIKTLCA
jgi:hypothetical protein